MDDLANRFAYHAPSEERAQTHAQVRVLCAGLADYLDTLLPDGREKALALMKIEEAMFWSNAAIARAT